MPGFSAHIRGGNQLESRCCTHERFATSTLNWETAEADWVAGHRLPEMELMPPFRATLVRLGLL